MAAFDYEVVNGRKIRVRPKETVSEIDSNGYFRRQPNHFTKPFGDGPDDLKAEGNGRYRLIWAKLCHWSNRAAIVRELEGLDDQISANMVEHAPHEKNLGWEYVYSENNEDPVLHDQFLSESYYRADDDYAGRTTVPALVDTKTGKVVNNDYNWLTNYLEVQFRPWHAKNAPDLYPEEKREEIDAMNLWLFDNINNAVYRSTFSQSNAGHDEAYRTFYAAMDRLEKRLSKNRFLLGDYVTDSDIRLYVTLARLDIRYTAQLGETKHPLFSYPNLWGYARELWEIPAFRNNTFFADFAKPGVDAKGDNQRTFNYRFLKQIDFDSFWTVEESRGYLSKDPDNKFLASPDAGSARSDDARTAEQKADAEIYRKLHAVKSTVIDATPEIPVVKDPASLPTFEDNRAQIFLSIKSELLALPDGVETRPDKKQQEIAQTDGWVKEKITDTVTTLLTSVELTAYKKAYKEFFEALDTLDEKLSQTRFVNGDFVTDSDIRIFATLVQFDAGYSRYLGPVLHRVQDYAYLWPYLRDLYQIPAFFHAVDWKAIVQVEKEEGGRAYMPNAWYDRFLPAVDLDALWKAETIDRAALSEDPTHPLYLSANPRFSLDPSWYDLGAEGKPSSGGCCG